MTNPAAVKDSVAFPPKLYYMDFSATIEAEEEVVR
jgi:hypothetical protein